ncbi:hypothetical protein AK830_g4351 [Neonectria ditissima]|uniref:DUF6604 domain-containing protein n=1 Tax=Neonectria ditissima TaxID=78410 RepID=A0A0P7B6R7_9HYPO|nr:hypothetical protein AK830_g4351 [Neonectria ditissima]
MLPSSLKSIYQQYKNDTDSVAIWLATTAKANGYADDAPSPNNAPVKSGRRKGKARKPANPANKTSRIIKIRDFEPMASHIAKTDSIKVPHHLTVALERVIWVRKTFSKRLVESGVKADPSSDQRHSFFVRVLEKVRDCLKPLMGAGSFNVDEAAKKAGEKSQDPVKNIFDILKVYTPSEAFLNAPDVAAKPATDTEYTVEEDESAEDAIFALVALLGDYSRLRKEIKSLWADYQANRLDLAAAAVATNTAFELARSMEDEILPIMSKHGGKDDLLTAYFVGLCKLFGIDALANKQPGDGYNLKAYNLAQLCLVNTISLLTGYAKANPGDLLINNYNGKFGWYDEELGADGETNRAKWNQDKTAISEVLPDLNFLSSNLGTGAVEDELIRGMGALMEKPDEGSPLWLAWAAQIYLDVLQSLGSNCGRGFEEMKQESFKIKKAMLDVPNSQERNRVIKAVTKWDRDPLSTCRLQMSRLGLLPDNGPPAWRFLHRNPIHCGLLLHNMRVNLHVSGATYAATPGGVMCTTQLYHALRQEKLLPDHLAWEDLDTFWKMQGDSAVFVGDPPTNREDYFKNYCLCIGVSVSNWAPTKRKGKVNVNTANRRNMKFKGWVSLVVNRRLAPTGERPPLSSDLIEGILIEGRRHEALDGKGHIRPEVKGKVNNETIDSVSLSPTILIRKLALNIHAEISDIGFNYFTMHNSAWKFLTELKEEFTRLWGAEFLRYIPKEDKLPYVVGYVFSTAAGRTGLTRDDKAEPRDDGIDAAARVMRKFLEDGRGRVVKEQAETDVEPEELKDAEFSDYDPWRLDGLMTAIMKRGEAMGGFGRGGAAGDCPMQRPDKKFTFDGQEINGHRYITAAHARAQIQAAPPPQPRPNYPSAFGNIEKLPIGFPGRYEHTPLLPGQTSPYRDEQPGALRAIYNDHDRTNMEVSYHDRRREMTPGGTYQFSLAHYHAARRSKKTESPSEELQVGASQQPDAGWIPPQDDDLRSQGVCPKHLQPRFKCQRRRQLRERKEKSNEGAGLK